MVVPEQLMGLILQIRRNINKVVMQQERSGTGLNAWHCGSISFGQCQLPRRCHTLLLCADMSDYGLLDPAEEGWYCPRILRTQH